MKKGFTLIELLAVLIVLAAIIAMITPVISGLVTKSKNSIYKSDIKMYAESIKKAILAYEMEYKVMPTKLSQIQQFMEKDGNEVSCETTIIYDRDNIYLEKCTVDGKELKDYTYGQKICTLVEGNPKEIGSKYQCKVKDDMEAGFEDGYYFYVLSTNNDGTYNLILDRNICEDGTLTSTTKTDKCLVAWNTSGSNGSGPVTAMTYLHNATKTWTNIPVLNYEYKDKEWQESLGKTFKEDSGYESFTSVDGVASIRSINGDVENIGNKEEPLRARMPIYTIIKNVEYGEVAKYSEGNSYLYENLSNHGLEGQPMDRIEGIDGYWTSSTRADIPGDAWFVKFGSFASLYSVGVVYDGGSGVRPVINLKL